MDDDDDKLVSHEVHLRQLSSTPMSALQLRRLSKSVTHSAPPDLKQQGTEALKQEQQQKQEKQASLDEVDQGVVLRRAVERGAITLAQIDDLKLDGDDDDVDYTKNGAAGVGGLSNPAVQTTPNDEQITATKVTTTEAAATTTAASPGEVSSICGQRQQHSELIKNKT